MANWSRKKVFKLAKGFRGARKNVFSVALRAVQKAQQYAYRDRRVKRRTLRRSWIHTINAAVREHGLTYSRFANALVKQSNIELDRKILSNLAVNEPYSFKSVMDEVRLQAGLAEIARRKPLVHEMQGVSYAQALEKGLIVHEKRRADEVMEILKEPKVETIGLRYPEKDAKTERDYLRVSFQEEDEEWRKNMARLTLTEREQKRLPMEVLTDDWKEDMSLYKHKRKP